MTTVALVFLLVFFGLLVVLCLQGGIRQFRRLGWCRRGVVLQVAAAILTCACVVLCALVVEHRGEPWLGSVPGLLWMLVVFSAVVFCALLARSVAVLRRPLPAEPVDCIVVLGAGLVDGLRVTRLLAGRIDRGNEVWRSQGCRPLLVFSGGRGQDELVSEADAMCAYALECGVPRSSILLEERSTSTRENLAYSRELLEERPGSHRCVVVTNEFHLTRAERLASKTGLSVCGVACRTSREAWAAAFVREYFIVLSRSWPVAVAVGAVWGMLALLF